MPGGIYQLNLKGTQDIFLTGNPEFNFIKQVYKRHYNFASQNFDLRFKNEVDFSKKFDIEIPIKGDFLHKLYFKFTLPALVKTSGTYAGWTNSVGHAIIDYVEISVGGHIVDRQYGMFLEIWDELTNKPSLNAGDYLLTGKYNHLESLEFNGLYETRYEVPLKFWFCNNIGASLPLISLRHHSIKITIKTNPFSECIVYDGATEPEPVSIENASLTAELIFIEDSERIKYSKMKHTYLINQVQSIMGESINFNNGGLHKTFLDFNHPCSELIFALREKENEDNNDWFNFSKRITTVLTPVTPLIKRARLILDGNERYGNTDEYSLRILNNNRFHSFTTNKHIYTMPFCNEPEKWYPTGSLNFSLIDNPELHIEMENNINSPVKVFVFARNFNIIHISDGLVNLGWSC